MDVRSSSSGRWRNGAGGGTTAVGLTSRCLPGTWIGECVGSSLACKGGAILRTGRPRLRLTAASISPGGCRVRRTPETALDLAAAPASMCSANGSRGHIAQPPGSGDGRRCGRLDDLSRRSLYTKPFILAAVANFLFFSNLNAYTLLPLYIQQTGRREGQIGMIMAMYWSRRFCASWA